VLLGNGDGTFQAARSFPVGLNAFAVAVGDFNGDGKRDLAVANFSSNNVSVLLGNGDGTFQAAQNFATGSLPQSVAVGDFNGDGKLDIAAANRGTANIAVLINNTGQRPDFSLFATTQSASVSAGQTANYFISVNPLGGFNQTVSLACSGAPARATCTVSPAMIQVSETPAAAMVSVTTTAPSHGFALPLIRHSFPKWNRMQTPFLLALFAVVLILCLLLGREQQQQRAWSPWPLIALICFGLTMTSCGGGSSSSNGGGGSAGTQAGSYTITVTGSFTSGSTTLTHSTKLTLIVQ
jgi:FG-GAP-like repeat